MYIPLLQRHDESLAGRGHELRYELYKGPVPAEGDDGGEGEAGRQGGAHEAGAQDAGVDAWM